MHDPVSAEQFAQLVDPNGIEALDVMGPLVQVLTSPEEEGAPCIMRGTIPPGVLVPLHSHADPETFLSVSGELEGFVESAEGARWIAIRPGDVFHVPSGAKHAFRNQSSQAAVALVASTSRLGKFFREVGLPAAQSSGPPSDARVRHFLKTAERYGYWNASPEENAEIGFRLPAAAPSR